MPHENVRTRLGNLRPRGKSRAIDGPQIWQWALLATKICRFYVALVAEVLSSVEEQPEYMQQWQGQRTAEA